MFRIVATLIACTAIIAATAATAFAQRHPDPRSNPFLAPQFLPPGIGEIDDLPNATIELHRLYEIRCHLVDRFTTPAQLRDDLTYLGNPSGEPSASIAPAITTALRETRSTLDDYRRGVKTLAVANAIRPKWGAIRTVTDLGFAAWERCGRPPITDRATRPCVYARGRELLAGMSASHIAEFRSAKDALFEKFYGTASWFGTTYCTPISDAYQVDWANMPPPNPAIMFLLEHPEQFCDAVAEIASEGFCLLVSGRFVDTGAQSLRTACRLLTGPAYDIGMGAGDAIGRWRNRNFLERAEYGTTAAGAAFDIAAFGCEGILELTCDWLTEAPARAERDRCVADLVELRKDIERRTGMTFGRRTPFGGSSSGGGGFRDDTPSNTRTVEHLEEILRQRGASLDD